MLYAIAMGQIMIAVINQKQLFISYSWKYVLAQLLAGQWVPPAITRVCHHLPYPIFPHGTVTLHWMYQCELPRVTLACRLASPLTHCFLPFVIGRTWRRLTALCIQGHSRSSKLQDVTNHAYKSRQTMRNSAQLYIANPMTAYDAHWLDQYSVEYFLWTESLC